MIKEKNVESLEQSAVKLTITVDKETVQKEYNDLVSGYAKTAQIKGFRKGKVPKEVLERKFGEGFRIEAMEKILNDSLKEAFDEIEEKPLPYSTPKINGEPTLDLEKDFTYSVNYDVYPELTLGEYTGLTVTVPKVEVSDEDLDRELKTLQEQNSIVTDKEGGEVEKDNIVTVDYWEVGDEGEMVDGTKREDFVFTVGSGYNLYQIDDDILGLKIDDEAVIEKTYPEDLENKDLAGQTKKIGVTVKAIKERQLPDLDDELAQDISDTYETLDDLKKDVQKRLEETAESRMRSRKIDGLLSQIVEETEVEVPHSMIYAEAESSWRNFVQQFRASETQVEQMLAAQGSSKEEMLGRWHASAEERLKQQLVVAKLIELEGIEADKEQVEEAIKEQAERSQAEVDDVRKYYEDNGLMSYIEHEIAERKLHDVLLEKNFVKEEGSAKLLDLLQGN